ncbi:MAG: cysteate synthase [Prolixibacteraceae bacterium]|jgi:cysteate synthase|nr:cysteate synthase [Prolixibacteraceae bacterium]
MDQKFQPTSYTLQSVETGQIFDDKGWTLESETNGKCSLLRAVYDKKQIGIKDHSLGLYRFADWMPVCRMLKGSSAPVTYKSEGLARKLGLHNLWITFNGYWPEKGVEMKTCSFKETEAYSVCGRMSGAMNKILVVASAGNTARAFARVCSDNNIPLLLCVPEDNLDALWFDQPVRDCVKLICSRSGGDYFDAIHLSNLVVQLEGFIEEGGAKNVARRDGMSTTMISAVTTIGEIPEFYFQAVGSGTGAIAAWEANLRFLEDGRFGSKKARLMVSQNEPFVPIKDAWKAKSRKMLPLDDDLARRQVEEIDAKVLSNRKPPYAIFGGLFDALKDTNGDVLSATNQEGRAARSLFIENEGNDIHPASAIAVATLVNAVADGIVSPNDVVVLNITGGGEDRFKHDKKLYYLKPQFVFDLDPGIEEVAEKVLSLFNIDVLAEKIV